MKIWAKLRALFLRRRLEREMAAEMQAHLDELAERNVAAGMAPEEARYAARRAFGGVEQIKERAREVRRWRWAEELAQDVRFGLRGLCRTPGFTVAALMIVAIGIGANTAIFSFVDGVLLKAPPYPEPDRIMYLGEKSPQGRWSTVATPNYLDWARQNSVFEHMAASRWAETALTEGKTPERLNEEKVTAHFFDVLGVKPALGRAFLEEEDEPGRNAVVILRHKFWVNRFGADAGIIGRTLLLEGKPHVVVGVMPPGIFDRRWAQIYRPMAFAPDQMARANRWLPKIYGRLKPGVTVDEARTQLDVIAGRLAREYPASNKGWSVNLIPYEQTLVGKDVRQSLWLLMAAVGLVLLIACANLANLTLARGVARAREVAIRMALGASRGRLVRQFLTESLMLSLTGGALGIAVSHGVMAALKLAPPGGYLPETASVALDGRALGFAVALSLLTGLVFGLVPALRVSRLELNHAMKNGGSGAGTGPAHQWLRDGLIVAEVALAFVLFAGAGLLMRSFLELQKVDTGFDSTNLGTAYLPVAEKRFATGSDLNLYLRQIIERIGALPGVRDVALTSAPPINWGWGWGVQFRLTDAEAADMAHRPYCGFKMVTASYFRTMGLRLVRGRWLTERDAPGAPPAVVISESMARKYFPETDPIGRRVYVQERGFAAAKPEAEVAWEVVGVVADEKNSRLREENPPGLYVTQEQSPTSWQFLVVRGESNPLVLEQPMKKALHEIHGSQVMDTLVTFDRVKTNAMGTERRNAWLLMIFSAAALLLAGVGLYGVISYTVAQRTREIGIRTALGASPASILRLVLRGGMKLTGLGLLLGLGAALGLAQVIASLLFNVGKYDPVTLGAVGMILAVTALLACWLPARRAAKVDPIVALRCE